MRRRSLRAAVLAGLVLLVAAAVAAPGAGHIGVARATTVAEGGDRISDVDIAGVTWRVHEFTTPGTAMFRALRELEVEVLLVAGGGGGGVRSRTTSGQWAGGGGAGGMLEDTATATVGDHTIVVGAGGAHGSATSTVAWRGEDGGDSTAFGLTAVGGGGGAGASSGAGRDGAAGGSGGGGAHDNGAGAAGTGTPGQGSDGGVGHQPVVGNCPDDENGCGGGGGGGATASGTAGSGMTGGAGGAGRTSDITGTTVTYAGGGGGGGNDVARSGAGGAGGGGIGMTSAGIDGTGGGAGAGAFAGGSGIVVVRYRLPADEPATVAAVALPPSVACTPTPPVAGATLTCAVTGAEAGIAILWRAAAGDATVLGEVLPDADGSGTFPLVVPPAVGAMLSVELVAWDAPTPIGTVAGPVPTVVRAGGGPGRVAWPVAPVVLVLVLGASLSALVTEASRRRRSSAAR